MVKKLSLTGILSLKPKGKGLQSRQAFTLVELIVVITILAILGTIAFISLQGYAKSSRNSVRISDINNIKTSLELFHLNAGKYPETTDGFSVIYSGSVVWNQGIFGEDTFKNVSKLDKVPVDPLTLKEYTYSLLSTKQEYQLGGLIEGDGLALNKSISATNAGDTLATALVTGNYNGKILKTNSGVLCEVLSVPSIISAQPSSVTDLVEILSSLSLVYDGYNNLPSNYINSMYDEKGGFDFESNQLVVYSDNNNCQGLLNPDDNTGRNTLLTNLNLAYGGTIIENEETINEIINIDPSVFDLVGVSLVNNNLGGKLDIPASPSTPICSLTQAELDELNAHAYQRDLRAVVDPNERMEVASDWSEALPGTEENWCNVFYLEWHGLDFVPSGLWKLTSLTELWLSANGITNIPSEIGNLTNLQFLYADSNNLINIPSEIGNLTNLKDLDLGFNSLNIVSPEIGNLTNLTSLDLGNNNLDSVPTVIGNLTKLQYLDLSNNNLESIPTFIGNFTDLVVLNFNDNLLINVASELQNLNNLRYFKLLGNTNLGNLNSNFDFNSVLTSQATITPLSETVSIEGNSTNIVITVTP